MERSVIADSRHPPNDHSALHLRWLGTAGIELRAGAQTLLIDPYVTRVSLRQMLFERLAPDTGLINSLLPKADILLVSHAHFDHLLDVPALAQRSGAPVFGSANTCRILSACGVSPAQIHEVRPGDQLDLGVFRIAVYPAEHEPVLGRVPYRGPARSSLRPPLRAAEYRFDVAVMYHIQIGDTRLLFTGSAGPAPDVQADIVLLGSTGRRAFYQGLLGRTNPALALLIHWDMFWRPLSQPLRPITCFPIKMVNPPRLARRLQALAPGLRVVVPKALRDYTVEELRSGDLLVGGAVSPLA